MSNDQTKLDSASKHLKIFFRKRVSSPEDADDLVQTVFFKMLNSKNELLDDSKFLPWMYKIARNTLVDYYRSKKAIFEEFEDRVSEEFEEDNLNEEFVKCIQPMISKLPEKYATALNEIEINGLKQHEYAEKNELSISGAKSRIQRARALLLDQINNCCKPITDSFGNVVDQKKKSDCCE